VFAFNGFQWIETEKIVPTDGYSYDHFGVALALDGSTLLIGSEGDDDKEDNSGSAYIFRFIDDTWVQDAKILTIDGEKNDEVASSVALYKNTVLVSAYRDDDLGEDAGAVYWFGITHSACCPGDVNDDGIVDTDDLFIVLGEWGNDGSSPGDINDDDIVNTDDLFIILNNWGMSC
jgi:hypothetical protein